MRMKKSRWFQSVDCSIKEKLWCSVVTVSSFGRQKLIENMMTVSVYTFKQVINTFLKELCYSWGFRTTVTKFLAAANKCIKPSNVSSRAERNSTTSLTWRSHGRSPAKTLTGCGHAILAAHTSGKMSRDPERSRSWPKYIWMQISRKWLKIETRFQWDTNRK